MNAYTSIVQDKETPSLDDTLHAIRDDLAAARVAAMQVLVFHVQAGLKDADDVKPEDFMQAVSDVAQASTALKDIGPRHLAAHGIELPEDLSGMVRKVSGDLSELMRILERCRKSGDDAIRGFEAGPGFYDLCHNRVAKGLSDASKSISAFFQDLSSKEKAVEAERTNKIALEIGKIGRVINMVATNASIEAARVGDAGKGFTVIADEVKTLSTRVSTLSVSLTERAEK